MSTTSHHFPRDTAGLPASRSTEIVEVPMASAPPRFALLAPLGHWGRPAKMAAGPTRVLVGPAVLGPRRVGLGSVADAWV
jgi:hypothetical protein